MTVAYFKVVADVTVASESTYGGTLESNVATITPLQITSVDTDNEDIEELDNLETVIGTGGWIVGTSGIGCVGSIDSEGTITSAVGWYGSDVENATFVIENIPRGTEVSQLTKTVRKAFNAMNSAAAAGLRILSVTSAAESLTKIDALVNPYIISRTLTAPPTSPAAGDEYIVGESATGAWSGYDGYIAYYLNSDWVFYQPFAGLTIFSVSDNANYYYDGSGWATASGSSTSILGGADVTVNTTLTLSDNGKIVRVDASSASVTLTLGGNFGETTGVWNVKVQRSPNDSSTNLIIIKDSAGDVVGVIVSDISGGCPYLNVYSDGSVVWSEGLM